MEDISVMARFLIVFLEIKKRKKVCWKINF
jgi:hypothetical protein